jgi:hypothetical protein
MTKNKNRPPAGQSWIWLTLEMMKSDAWRSAGINCRRFIDFLLIEFMGTAGEGNGKLKAPYEQLEQVGISARYIADAIDQAETLGLVRCCRGGMRVATTYTMTWLDTGTEPATNDWRAHRNPKLNPWPTPKKKEQKP